MRIVIAGQRSIIRYGNRFRRFPACNWQYIKISTPMMRHSCFVYSAVFSFLSLLPLNAQTLPKQPFGKMPDGRETYLYTLKNSSGMEVRITNYGGTIEMIRVKDRHGKFDDVVLGFSNLAGYTDKSNTSYFGALIGRYGNRIAGGTFTLDGKTYHIPTNDTPRPNSLHGGTVGFNKRVWDAKDVSTSDTPALELHYLSPDGEEGFPG